MLNHKPHKGSFICWPGDTPYRVVEAREDGICIITRPDRDDPKHTTSFIYMFRDGWNKSAFHCDENGEEVGASKTDLLVG